MKKIPLEECCDILDSQRIPITAKDRKEGPYPYYGANGVQDYVAEYIFDDDLVLLAEDGGNFGSKERPIAYRVSGKCWVNNHAHVLKPKAGTNVDYLCYALMFYDTSGLVNGATRQKLTQAAMRQMTIPAASIEEQLVIVNKFSRVEQIKRKREEQLQALDELIKARFVEMFGDIANNSLNLKEVTVADCCKMTQGTQIPMADQISEYQEGYYRYLYIRDLKYDNDDWIYVRDQYDEKKLTERDLVVVNTGNTAGEIYRGKDGILSNNLFKVSFDSELLLPTYLFYYFRSEAFQKMLWSEMKEGTQPHLGHKIFGSKKLLIPHIYAQEQFESFVKQVDKSKVVVQKALDEAQLLFDSLMQQYFG